MNIEASQYRSLSIAYGLTILILVAATLIRLAVDPWIGDQAPFGTYLVSILIVAWYFGLGPTILAFTLSVLAVQWLFEPPGGLSVLGNAGWANIVVVSMFGIALGRMRQRVLQSQAATELHAGELARRHEQLRITLASIGDAVITTDTSRRITMMNSVAESLTGWSNTEAVGMLLDDVFQIVNEETRERVESPAHRVLQQGVIVGLANHTVLIARDGQEHPIDDSAAPVLSRTGEIVGCVLVFRDVSERHKQDRKLRLSEERYRALISATAQIVWTTDVHGQVVEDSPSWRAFTGQTHEQWLGSGWLDAIHPDDRQQAAKVWAAAVENRTAYEIEYRVRSTQGDYRWTWARGVPVLEANGSIREWVGINMDITDRKLADVRIRESELRYRLIGEVANDAIWDWDLLTNEVNWNEGVQRRFGYTQEQIGASADWWSDRIHTDDRARILESIHHAIDAAQPRWSDEYRFRCSDGDYAYVLDRGRIIVNDSDQAVRMIGSMLDITEQRRSVNRQRFFADLATATQPLIEPSEITNVTARLLAEYLDVNRCAYAEIDAESIFVITGDYSRDVPSIVGRWPVSSFGKACEQAMLAGEAYVVSDAESDLRLSAEDRHAYRATNIRAVICIPLLKAGTFTAAMAVHQNTPRVWSDDEVHLVTTVVGRCWEALERARTTRQLRESEQRYRILTEVSPQTVWVASSAGEMIYCNQWWYDYTGLSEAETLGLGWLEAVQPEHREAIIQQWPTAEDEDPEWESEIPFRRRDGEYRWHLARGRRIYDVASASFQWHGVAIDVHDRKEANERERFLMADAVLAHAKFRAIFDQSPIFAGILDLNGKVMEVNRHCLEGTGYKSEELLGHPFWACGWWQGSDDVMHKIREATHRAAEGVPSRYVLPYWIADGRQRVVDFAIHPIRDESGTIVFLYPTGTDATERLETEARMKAHEQRFRTLVEQVKDYAIFMTDARGRPTSWNEGVERVLGFAESEFLGQEITSTIFTLEDQAQDVPQRELDEAAASGHASDDRWMRRRDGTAFWASGVTTALRNEQNELLGYMKVMRDQTERKHLEDELRQLATDLSEADRRKDEFLATLAHELRNPLAPIRTGLELMKLASDDPDVMEQTRTLMEGQTRQLVRLVDDLLDVSRITRGRIALRREPTRIGDVMSSAVAAVQPLIDQARHTLHINLPDEPVILEADSTRLAQIVSNLLSNAARYTPEGGEIWLTVRREENDVVVEVRDTGIGIPEAMHDRIFEMFTQVDQSFERSHGGLGIGLTLVKRLVELHGGTITVQSAGPLQGSKFLVRLPSTPSQPERTVPIESEPLTHHRLRVLVVDDNQDAASTLRLVIQSLGHQCDMAFSGHETLDIGERIQPDIILMDLGMPGMNGLETAHLVRQTEWGQSITLVALTGWGQEEDKMRSRRAGFDYHLTKPAEPSTIVQLLRSVTPGNN